MSIEQLALWLTHHPFTAGTYYRKDIEKLKGTCTCFLIVIDMRMMMNMFSTKSKWSWISEPEYKLAETSGSKSWIPTQSISYY